MQKTKLIIADSAMFLRAEVKDMLGDLDAFDIQESSSASETTQLLGSGDVDALLITVELCRSPDGFSVSAATKKHKQLKVMVLGNIDNLSELQGLVEEGAKEYLIRPFEAEDLRNKIDVMGIDG
tara:strand:+ start:145 stop:516 length:372 start_codon:yes stop_codon:yes gene_type:complete